MSCIVHPVQFETAGLKEMSVLATFAQESSKLGLAIATETGASAAASTGTILMSSIITVLVSSPVSVNVSVWSPAASHGNATS